MLLEQINSCITLKYCNITRNSEWRWLVVDPYSARTDFRRRILTFKVDSRTVRVKICIMDVDTSNGYFIGSKRAEFMMT